jgi:hypothetical protein
MSALTYEAGYSLFERVVNTGASQESRKLEEMVWNSINLFRERSDRKQVYDDLYSAVANSRNAVREKSIAGERTEDIYPLACRFLNSLPSNMPSPTVDIDPDGEISFDWCLGRNRMFSISLNGEGRLSYAGIFGAGKKQHGEESFDDAIPEAVIRCIQRLQVSG